MHSIIGMIDFQVSKMYNGDLFNNGTHSHAVYKAIISTSLLELVRFLSILIFNAECYYLNISMLITNSICITMVFQSIRTICISFTELLSE